MDLTEKEWKKIDFNFTTLFITIRYTTSSTKVCDKITVNI